MSAITELWLSVIPNTSAIWVFGMTRTWIGATGLISSNANKVSVSSTFLHGMFPATISQNKQSLMAFIVYDVDFKGNMVLELLWDVETHKQSIRQ